MIRSTTIFLFIALLVLGSSCSSESESIGQGGSSAPIVDEKVVVPSPVFTGVDQNGQEFDSQVLNGKPWIASFFFTTCQGVCPRLNIIQSELQSEFGESVKFVSISTDPDVDDVAALRSYADDYNALDNVWWLLRMPEDEMRVLSEQGFKLIDPEEPAMHSSRFVAVDGASNIAGYFDSEDENDVEALRTWMRSQQ